MRFCAGLVLETRSSSVARIAADTDTTRQRNLPTTQGALRLASHCEVRIPELPPRAVHPGGPPGRSRAWSSVPLPKVRPGLLKNNPSVFARYTLCHGTRQHRCINKQCFKKANCTRPWLNFSVLRVSLQLPPNVAETPLSHRA